MVGGSDIYPYQRVTGRGGKGVLSRPALRRRGISSQRIRWRTVWRSFAWLAGAFLLARGVLWGDLAPFVLPGAAAIAIASGLAPWLVAAFSLTGLISVTSGANLLPSALTLAALATVLSYYQPTENRAMPALAVLVASVNLGLKGLLLVVENPAIYDLANLFLESAIIAGLTPMLYLAANSLGKWQGYAPPRLATEEWACLALLGLGLLAGLRGIEVAGIDAAGILGRLGVLVAALIGGAGMGAAVGTVVGLLPVDGQGFSPAILAVYSASGLLAGCFRGLKRPGVLIGFLLGGIGLATYLLDSRLLLDSITELLIAGIAFGLIPGGVLEKNSLLQDSTGMVLDRRVGERRWRDLLANRFQELGLVFQGLAEGFQVASSREVNSDHGVARVLDSLAARVCQSCSMSRFCWEQSFYNTYQAFLDLQEAAIAKGQAEVSDLPDQIKNRCRKVNDLILATNCLQETRRSDTIWQERLEESRILLTSQLRGLAQLLSSVARDTRAGREFRQDLETRLRGELAAAGVRAVEINVLSMSDANLEIDMYLAPCRGDFSCQEVVPPLVTAVLGKHLLVDNSNCPLKGDGSGLCHLHLVPASGYRLVTGFAQCYKQDSQVSGDFLTELTLKDGRQVLMISDGMGGGPLASREAKTTVTLVERLLSVGFGEELAVKTVNWLMLLHSLPEQFATLDLAVLNCFSGGLTMIKVGAAPTLVKKPGGVELFRGRSLPVGILQESEPERLETQIEPGDLLVMVSDGFFNLGRRGISGEGWLVKALEGLEDPDPQEAAEYLLEQARVLADDRPRDDMTVLVGRLVRL